MTPAFTLPRAFEQSEAYAYHWLESVNPSGVLLTIPPKPQFSLIFKDDQGRVYSLYLDQ